MSYVEQALGEGEVVRHVAHKHWVIFVVPVFQLVVGLVLFGIGYKSGDLWAWLGWLMRGLGLIITIFGALHLLGAWLTRITTELAVTNRKVIGKWGLISRRTIEQRLEKIDSIEVEQTILGRILGYGTVEVRGSGVSMTPLRMIGDPLTFRRRVEDALNAARADFKARPQSQDLT
ncbi:MAG: PH domain-containing protein [Hyphomicrobiales bacterium]|nr:PH domain-containing protein [Hyphomicrobiales bacterium]MBV9433588.1 PH domain-containing protein [Hyphomicrobiales bacterium]MBV9742051.1 PH domain-containing protein [Hyphomicrobiales bacterium]MBW0001884.1 PH domain-containing protein [Hyphomicrobiales bacterium]